MRKAGCSVLGAIYAVIALSVFSMIVIGDCATEEPFHSRCEASKDYWLLGLIVVSLAVAALLYWLFIGRTSREDIAN